MSVSLKKGQKVSLSKEHPQLSRVIVGLGWDAANQPTGFFAKKPKAIDCDAFALLLQGDKLVNKSDIVYFGNLRHESNSVMHMGDNLTGEGAGDDEQIVIELGYVPAPFTKIVIGANVYESEKRKQHFGMIQNAFIRLVDAGNNTELCRYNLTDDYAGQTALIFGEVYRYNGEWKFSAVGQGTTDTTIRAIADRYC